MKIRKQSHRYKKTFTLGFLKSIGVLVNSFLPQELFQKVELTLWPYEKSPCWRLWHTGTVKIQFIHLHASAARVKHIMQTLWQSMSFTWEELHWGFFILFFWLSPPSHILSILYKVADIYIWELPGFLTQTASWNEEIDLF